MAASNTNLDTLHLVIPTPGPQVYVDAQGAPITFDPDVVGQDLNDIFLSQPVLGPAVLTQPDGTTPNLDAAVLTPYSLVTPPGAIRVG